MTENQDLALAETLWRRSEKFASEGNTEDAIIGIMAAYRLMSLNGDVRVSEVHARWTAFFQQSRLEQLLVQIQERRHSAKR